LSVSISTEGGPTTIASFRQKYPWAPRVFRACRQYRFEEAKRRAEFLAKARAQTQ
jgi:hypothetical protein